MDLVVRALDSTNLFNSLPKYGYLNVLKDDQRLENSETVDFPLTDAEKGVVNAIYEDNKAQLVANLEKLLCGVPNIKLFRLECSDEIVKQTVVLKLLCLCCEFDSVECASALLNGEVCGVVPLVNEYDECGFTALHTAAARHSAKCVELLLRKRARTDLKTKEGKGVIALELSLSSNRMEVVWNPDDHLVEDLIVCLSEKNLTSVSLLSDTTKELGDVAFANAVGGRIVPLVALLIVAADKLKEMVLELHDSDLASKEKITIYEGVIKEALSLGGARMPTRAVKRTYALTETEIAEKRKLLLCEVELLQLFGVTTFGGCRDRKVTSQLIRASQARDLDIIQLFLRMNIDVNDVDAEGSTALHWSVKTSKGSCPQQMKILSLLLKNGARVNQTNKLGLTAVHVAAANGNLEALNVLLLEFPDGINCKTEMKETPLFFAVKNDNTNCVQLLLQLGACTEVLNLRKQRPIDLAKSEDVRFLLSSANISLVNHVFPIQQERSANKEFDEVLETCEKLHTAGNTMAESTKVEICKYFKSPGGCIRGAKCFYAHEKSEHWQSKLRNLLTHSIASKELKCKIFVGGLPPTLDSGSLGKIFEEHFGFVEDAIVFERQSDSPVEPYGFGFVTFKEWRSVLAALQAQSVIIQGKIIEIKSSVPRVILLKELQKLAPPEQVEQGTTQEQNSQDQCLAETLLGKNVKDGNLGHTSWVDKLFSSEALACSAKPRAPPSSSPVDRRIPTWFMTFKKWLPSYLQDASNRLDGKYPLSSLKADFRAACGLELDHISLGYSKLSNFIKSLPDLCHVKTLPLGKYGSPSHMVLLPNSQRSPELVAGPHALFCSASLDSNHNVDASGHNNSEDEDDKLIYFDDNADGSKDLQDQDDLLTHYDDSFIVQDEAKKESPCHEAPKQTADSNFTVNPRFLQFLKPDPIHYALSSQQCDGTSGNPNDGGLAEGIKGKALGHQERHVALEALASKQYNKSVFFLRQFDFYKNYSSSIAEGMCFACGQREMLFANFPCKHLLWCGYCDMQFECVANTFEHKCVICDKKVQKTDLLTGIKLCHPNS